MGPTIGRISSNFSALQPTWQGWPAARRQALQTILTGAILGLIFFSGMALVQFATPNLPDNDGFYHIRFAALMRTQGLRPAFPWLPLTILNPREFYDHHFLFHVALIPFTFGDLLSGAKWAAVTFSSLAFLCVWWLLRGQRVPYAGLWSLGLLAVSEAFLYRMSITRAQSLSLAVLAVGLHWLLTGKHARLGPLAFVYVWMYDAFPLLFLLAGVYVLAAWAAPLSLAEPNNPAAPTGQSSRRINLRPLIYTGIGIGLGLLINPYFPNDIIFAVRHILPKLGNATAVSVGSEWYPYTTLQLLENTPLALAAFLAGVLALGFSGKRMSAQIATALFAATLFGLMLFQARRFVEYFPAFALIFAAMAWAPLLEGPREQPAGAQFPPERRLARRLSLPTLRRWLPAAALFLFLLPGGWVTLHAAQASMRNSQPYDLYASASAWLEQNSPAGTRVFQTDWDDFPRLFFYNTRNTYLVGLDPTYLQLADPTRYDLWVKITQGEVKRPAQDIASRFGASYVLTDLKHSDFIRQAEIDPGLREVYRDEQAIIFQLNP